MFIFNLFVLLLRLYETQSKQLYYEGKYKKIENAESSHRRVFELMRSYYEEANARITYLNNVRFMYEESPYYEMGYITHEIIERYRKVLEHVQRPVRFHHMPMFERIKEVEYVQKLSFEIYHLVRMLHETPRKWVSVLEFINIEKTAGPDRVAGLSLGKGKDEILELTLAELFKTQDHLKDLEKRRESEKRRKRKEYAKIRKIYLESLMRGDKISKANKTKLPFKIDYGWEISYWW